MRVGEPLKTAVTRAAVSEVEFNLPTGTVLGYIEYPSRYLNGRDSPVGLAFLCPVAEDQLTMAAGEREWFTIPTEPTHRAAGLSSRKSTTEGRRPVRG